MASEVPVFHGPFAILNLCKCAGLGLKDITSPRQYPLMKDFAALTGNLRRDGSLAEEQYTTASSSSPAQIWAVTYQRIQRSSKPPSASMPVA